MQWPDETAQQSGQPLEKVIGYSDGGSFASRIGPQAIDSSSAGGGRFADLVQSRVIAARESEGQQQQEHLRSADAEGIDIMSGHHLQEHYLHYPRMPPLQHLLFLLHYSHAFYCQRNVILTCPDNRYYLHSLKILIRATALKEEYGT